jgi:hypothetical protein
MKVSDELQFPKDPGAVPVSLRDAFAWVRDADRASSPAALPSDDALDALAADDADADDDARLATFEQLLGSQDGARTIAHLIAARTSTTDTADYFSTASSGLNRVATTTTAAVRAIAGERDVFTRLKPVLLAASLMLVAGTSWYVMTSPQTGDEIRSNGSAVELLSVPPSAMRTPITLRWRALRSDARYSVEVLDANDAPVFSNETNQTQATMPASSLKPGTYRWYVRARASDGTEIRSRVETFSIRG